MAPSLCIFSGRFDPPHIGHVVTILRLKRQFPQVLVVVLDYPERRTPICLTVQVLAEVIQGKAKIVVNRTHFAKITQKELKKLSGGRPFVYAAGNLEVLLHVERLGAKTLYTDRAYPFSARFIKMIKE